MSRATALTLVQRIIREHGPLTSKEIYRLAKQASASSVLNTSHHAATTQSSDPASLRSPGTSAHTPIVPSMSLLRKHILPEIQRSGVFEQIHTTHASPAASKAQPKSKSTCQTSSPPHGSKPKEKENTITSAWVWRVTPDEQLARLREEAQVIERRRNPPDPLVYDAEKGVLSLAGAPYLEHLNKRRRRARVQKLQRERELVKQVAKLRLDNSTEQAALQQ